MKVQQSLNAVRKSILTSLYETLDFIDNLSHKRPFLRLIITASKACQKSTVFETV